MIEATSTAAARTQPDCAGGLQSVLAALDLLTCFEGQEDLGVSELARTMGVAKSTAHRLLKSLSVRGYVEQDEFSGRYRLGLHMYELGHLAVSRNDIRNAALPLLQDLSGRTGATVHVGVLYREEVLFLERVVARQSFAAWSGVGRRQPIESSSSGKVLSAYGPCFVHGRLVGPLALALGTEQGRAARYRVALAETLKRGFAVSVNETMPGFSSVAAPVLGRDGFAYAAVSLVAPTAQILADLQKPAKLVLLAARTLTRELCH
jgi:DNA-binding IclR family transcriptional regulator